ncbi:MAG: hypothetical protein H6621_10895 [Halobacteriovoraceae bacterium]|nr:hypothetical protein [Halobacteriovoraceae bacterium]MCB9095565.1 hypothetical protein [Halobacteriovoraceae bacterium]
MKKHLYELVFLLVATFLFSRDLIAVSGPIIQDGNSQLSQIGFVNDFSCRTEKFKYPIGIVIKGACQNEFSNQLENDIKNFLVDVDKNDRKPTSTTN